MTTSPVTVQQHFAGKAPKALATYERLKKGLRKFGQWSEDPKKTSIHFTRKTAFAGIMVRRESIVLTVKASRNIVSSRILKSEQVSANRWHHEVRLTKPSDVDPELISWLREAYELSA